MSATAFISRRFNAGGTLPRSIKAMRAISITGIAIAVAALVVATAIGRGFESRYRQALMDFNAHVVVMGGGEIAEPDEVLQGIKPLREIRAATPFIYREALAISGGKILGVVVKGVDPSTMRDVNSMSVRLFEGFSSLEDALAHKGGGAVPAIAGRALADEFGIGQAPAKTKLLIPRDTERRGRGRQFEEVDIVGTFESGMHDYDAQFLLMSLRDIRRMFGVEGGAVSGVELRLSDPDKSDHAAAEIEEALGPKYRAITWSELNRDLLAAVRLEKLVSAVIMGIMVVVAALNVVAVLVLMTIHRLHEISVLKALGLPDRRIRELLVRGGASIGVAGVAAGLMAGLAAAWAIGRFDLIPLEAEIYLIGALPVDISPLICGMIATFCLCIALLTSFFASRQLAKVPVAEGLQMAR